jgi:hypothetical protein
LCSKVVDIEMWPKYLCVGSLAPILGLSSSPHFSVLHSALSDSLPCDVGGANPHTRLPHRPPPSLSNGCRVCVDFWRKSQRIWALISLFLCVVESRQGYIPCLNDLGTLGTNSSLGTHKKCHIRKQEIYLDRYAIKKVDCNCYPKSCLVDWLECLCL